MKYQPQSTAVDSVGIYGYSLDEQDVAVLSEAVDHAIDELDMDNLDAVKRLKDIQHALTQKKTW